MKNFFNKNEMLDHLAILACQGKSKELAKSNSITKEEQKCLEKASEWCEKFSQLVFKRFGLPYQRKLLCTLDSNDLLLVGKYAPKQETISMGASEDIKPFFEKVQGTYCLGCNGKNHLDCILYAGYVALGVEPKPTAGTDCPYWDKEKVNQFDIDEDFDNDFDIGADND